MFLLVGIYRTNVYSAIAIVEKEDCYRMMESFHTYQNGLIEFYPRSSNVEIRVNIAGELKVEITENVSGKVVHYSSPASFEWFSIGKQTAGEYTIKVTIDGSRVEIFTMIVIDA